MQLDSLKYSEIKNRDMEEGRIIVQKDIQAKK